MHVFAAATATAAAAPLLLLFHLHTATTTRFTATTTHNPFGHSRCEIPGTGREVTAVEDPDEEGRHGPRRLASEACIAEQVITTPPDQPQVRFWGVDFLGNTRGHLSISKLVETTRWLLQCFGHACKSSHELGTKFRLAGIGGNI